VATDLESARAKAVAEATVLDSEANSLKKQLDTYDQNAMSTPEGRADLDKRWKEALVAAENKRISAEDAKSAAKEARMAYNNLRKELDATASKAADQARMDNAKIQQISEESDDASSPVTINKKVNLNNPIVIEAINTAMSKGATRLQAIESIKKRLEKLGAIHGTMGQ